MSGATRLAVLGAGKMGEALLSGLLRAGTSPDSVVATARRPERATLIADKYGIGVLGNAQAVSQADVLL
ncbi:MAG TPA: NAD(P)-binding domain-containing protein, partial [Mycobacteriales bacterium]|nr:NAD(P)-binding domain-containing protein [Mycobacteriales bacterium]